MFISGVNNTNDKREKNFIFCQELSWVHFTPKDLIFIIFQDCPQCCHGEQFSSSINDTGKIVIAGVVDTGDKLFTSVNDTGDKLFTDVNSIADKFLTGDDRGLFFLQNCEPRGKTILV
jgi:hypothetical protein